MKQSLCFPVFLLAACSVGTPAPVATAGCQPFVDLDDSKATDEDRLVIKQASEDFCAVLAGEKPIHAKKAAGTDAPTDGGSSFYVGRKYKLTVLKSASSFGGYPGIATGPILKFDQSFAPGHTSEISSITVKGIKWAK